MNCLVTLSLFGCAFAAPGGYGSSGGSVVSSGYGSGGGITQGGYSAVSCSTGLVADALGNCVEPIVSRNIFSYAAPAVEVAVLRPRNIPKPRVEYNVVFVRTPEQPEGLEPIVIPPPEQRTIVYVLNEEGSLEQRVVEVPAGPNQEPEVIYVNYKDGDNPTLRGGVTLQEILHRGAERGEVIQGGGGFGGSGGYGSSGSGGFSSSSGGYGSVDISSSSGVYGGGNAGFGSSVGTYE